MRIGLEVSESKIEAVDIDHIPASIKERFEKLHFLGQGGMGSVYRGFDRQIEREVAIKFVHGGNANRFLREARAQARIEHDNVCKIYDVGVADGHPFIVMQLVRGDSLSAASKTMTLEEKLEVVREVAEALHEAHRLGLVHRDVKPSNIMVERSDDGQWRPFVMDFGLARIAGEVGETMTGHITGTPAYMAPEQARGDIRELDRRTDVYSLGATLYDILATRPPFVEDQTWKVLMRISVEDAPPLRSVWPAVPADVNTIVMKCLERDPIRRYESAKALGEDLQRYLDGDPIAARQGSVPYRLTRWARKNKVLVSAFLLAFVVVSTFIGIMIRARRVATEETRIARELGEDIKEMQLFLRYARALPLHDIERERKVIRGRLADIQAKLDTDEALGRGEGHYALGRGHLAMDEPQRALEHLLHAKQLGVRSPELEYALGRAHVEVYREQRERLRLIDDREKRAAQKAEINAIYRVPALEHLRAAKGSRLEHPAYVEALIALTEEHFDDALRLSKLAQDEAPWFYEATMVEAETHAALGENASSDNQFDYATMNRHYDAAMNAYRRAISVGSSDPSPYERACRMLYLWIYASALVGQHERAKSLFEEAKILSENAVAADQRNTSFHVLRAKIYSSYYSQFSAAEDLEAGIRKFTEVSEESARLRPDDAEAQWIAGASWRRYAMFQREHGRDDINATERASTFYEKSLVIDPNLVISARELAAQLLRRATLADRRGEDWIPYLNRAASGHVRAWNLSPNAPSIPILRADYLLWIATAQFRRGIDPSRTLDQADEQCQRASVEQPQNPVPKYHCLRVLDLRAQLALATGTDPTPILRRQDEAIGPSSGSLKLSKEALGMTLTTWAATKSVRGQSPEADALAAIEAFRQSGSKNDIQTAPAILILLQWRVAEKAISESTFDEYEKIFAAWLDDACIEATAFQIVAAIEHQRAVWLFEQGRDPAKAITRGLDLVEKSLQRYARFAPALATRGDLYLAWARATKHPRERADYARKARESFDDALTINRYLARETEKARAAVRQLLE